MFCLSARIELHASRKEQKVSQSCRMSRLISAGDALDALDGGCAGNGDGSLGGGDGETEVAVDGDSGMGDSAVFFLFFFDIFTVLAAQWIRSVTVRLG
jgi:hypothetical protein